MQIKPHIFWDMDGTIVDSVGVFGDLITEFCNLRGFSCDISKFVAGYAYPDTIDMGLGIPMNAQSNAYDTFVKYHVEMMNTQKRFIPEIYPSMKEVLVELNKQYAMSIVTANSRAATENFLDVHGVHGYFPNKRTLCCTKERKYGLKPQPDAILCLAKENKIDLNCSVMIGDSRTDIKMAHAAGIPSIAVAWGHTPKEQLADYNPTFLIDSVSQLPETIHRVFNPS